MWRKGREHSRGYVGPRAGGAVFVRAVRRCLPHVDANLVTRARPRLARPHLPLPHLSFPAWPSRLTCREPLIGPLRGIEALAALPHLHTLSLTGAAEPAQPCRWVSDLEHSALFGVAAHALAARGVAARGVAARGEAARGVAARGEAAAPAPPSPLRRTRAYCPSWLQLRLCLLIHEWHPPRSIALGLV